MGQYYTPILFKGNTKKAFYSHQFDNGLKLMEHSYIGNSFTESIVKYMLETGGSFRLAWVGDYAQEFLDNEAKGEEKFPNPAFYEDADLFGSKFRKIIQKFVDYERNETKKYFQPTRVNRMENSSQLVFVNHTKKEFVDMEHYCDDNKCDNWGCKIHPLPLLTAIGNGYGGGDYRGSKVTDINYVGTWAGDEIEVVNWFDNRENNYKEIRPLFKE